MELAATVNRVLEGNKEEFRHIIRACNQALYRTAIVILKNEADAEDAVQSTYLKAFIHLKSFRGESSFVTWITRILINECKMMMRGKKRTASLDTEEVSQKESIIENAVDTLYKNQIKNLFEKAILDLPEKYRIVYIVREVNDFSTQKTADVLGLSEENVKVRLHRAKSIIRENLIHQVDVKELFPFGNSRCEHFTDKVMMAVRSLTAERNLA